MLVYNSLTGEYEEQNDGEVTSVGGPNAQVPGYPEAGNAGYDPAQPEAPASPAPSTASNPAPSQPNYEQQIRDTYAANLGRQPTAAELASDLNNAQRYGTSGSLLTDIAARGSNTPGVGDRQGGTSAPKPPTSSTNSVVPSWNGSSGSPASGVDYYAQLLQQLMAQQSAAAAENKARADALYNTFNTRASQGLNLNPNDPIIKAQVDAFNAQQERASRGYLRDLAERSGPYANLRGEQRLSAERMGQAGAGFTAQLLGRELQSRRDEISNALASMGGLLSGDQTRALQQQLALLDNAIKQQNVNLTASGQGLDWAKALLQNSQFLSQLGLSAEQQRNYWDWVRSHGYEPGPRSSSQV